MTDSPIMRALAPRSVALIGATEDEGRIGGRLLVNLVNSFRGPVYPISPTRKTIRGLPTAASLADIDEVPDLALIAVRAEIVPELVEEAIAIGVPSVAILSSGFAEMGESGRAAQGRIAELARNSETRVIGPNIIGIINLNAGLVGTFSRIRGVVPGPVAVVSQSGGMGAGIFNELQEGGNTASILAVTGNEADVVASEFVEEIIELPEIRVVLVCVEGTEQPDRYMRSGERAYSLGKSILIAKIGTSEGGVRAVLGHTGAISTDYEAFRAAVHSAGIVTVENPKALADYVPVFLPNRRFDGRRIGVLATSGGNGVYLVDAASRAGFDVPILPDEEQSWLKGHLPSLASVCNPIDTTAQFSSDPDILPRVLTELLDSSSLDALVAFGIDALANGLGEPQKELLLEGIARACLHASKPMIVVGYNKELSNEFNRLGIPSIVDPDRAMAALSALAGQSGNTSGKRQMVKSVRTLSLARGMLAESALNQSRIFELLQLFGARVVQSRFVSNLDMAVSVAQEIGFPVALKMDSGKIIHKSDLGGVILNLNDVHEVSKAAQKILDEEEKLNLPPGIEIQEMIPPGIEIFCGMRRLDKLGAVLVVGLGGYLVEILAETQTLMATQDDDSVMQAIGRLCGGRLTSHRRGMSEGDVDALTRVVSALADLAVSLPEVLSFDVNPIIVGGNAATIVDAVCDRAT